MRLIIAGPCSAESEEQILTTAHALKSMGVSIFRAGLWKPRTNPNSFEGVGAKGLPWLMRVQNELGLPVATEVATAEHLRYAIKAGIRHIWLGARTTTNPFMVQEIADALKLSGIASEITAMIKNPVSPDIQLWKGSIERIKQSGVSNIYAIHRGFPTAQPTELRNQPFWGIPIELRQKTDIPILCDISHIAGNRRFLSTLAQQATDLCFDGMMIEVHPQPDKALSDKEQQLSIEQFKQLLESIKMPNNNQAQSLLLGLREQIDEIDNQLFSLIEQRMKVSTKIGQLKREQNLSVLQTVRFNQILANRIEWGRKHNISEKTICNILNALHEESINQQL